MPRSSLLVICAALLVGCQSPDVGQTCQLDLTVPPEASAADYLELGRAECENLVCIQSQVADGAVRRYCSKPCVSNSDCDQGDTGLLCRDVVLNETFIGQLQQQDPALAQKFLGPGRNSRYCATPLP